MLKDKEIRSLTKADAKKILKDLVYASTMFLERLEFANKLNEGVGYELRKEIVKFSISLLDEHWIKNVK